MNIYSQRFYTLHLLVGSSFTTYEKGLGRKVKDRVNRKVTLSSDSYSLSLKVDLTSRSKQRKIRFGCLGIWYFGLCLKKENFYSVLVDKESIKLT